MVQPKYRPDIDGLRAIAVLSVIGYHAFPGIIRGGFVGVDIFFVISGYLISRIIVSSLGEGTFSFPEFYARRIKRIFPALVVVLAACCVAGWFTLLPREYKELGKHIAGGAGFISNFFLWSESGYFNTAAEFKPLLHLWSLGIEEQFYIVWPVLLYLAWKTRFRPIWLMTCLILISFALNVYITPKDVAAGFYSPVTRFWELMLGAMLAWAMLNQKLGAAHNDVRAAIGGVLILSAIFGLSSKNVFPGWWALFPTVGAALVISAGPSARLNCLVLSQRGLVLIGLISFPLYLWHWPLLSFARILGTGVLSVPVRIGAIGMSALLASLTYVLIERPIRWGTPNAARVALPAVCMILAGLAGVEVYRNDGMRFGFRRLGTFATAHSSASGSLFLEYQDFAYDFRSDIRAGCWLPPEDGPEAYPGNCIDPRNPGAPEPLLLVWGDSHAGRFYPGIRNVFGRKFRLAQYARDDCPPVLNYGYANCARSNLWIMNKIKEVKPDILVMFATWNRYGQWGSSEQLTKNLGATLDELTKAGVKQIILVGPPPQWTIPLPRSLVNIYQITGAIPLRTNVALEENVTEVDNRIAEICAARMGVIYVSARKTFCNEEGCLTRVGEGAEAITTWDYGHFTTRGAEYMARSLPLSP